MNNKTTTNKSLASLNHSKSDKLFIMKRPSSAAWKTKLIQKKIEIMKKAQTETEELNKIKKLIHENICICKDLIEERKEMLNKNQTIQDYINQYIHDMQVIRRSNEHLHQESLKLTSNTSDMSLEIISYKREQCVLQKEIEKLQNEIEIANKIKYAKENEYWKIFDIVENKEEKVAGLNKAYKNAEQARNIEIESNRKILKKIKKIQKEINILNKMH